MNTTNQIEKERDPLHQDSLDAEQTTQAKIVEKTSRAIVQWLMTDRSFVELNEIVLCCIKESRCVVNRGDCDCECK